MRPSASPQRYARVLEDRELHFRLDLGQPDRLLVRRLVGLVLVRDAGVSLVDDDDPIRAWHGSRTVMAAVMLILSPRHFDVFG